MQQASKPNLSAVDLPQLKAVVDAVDHLSKSPRKVESVDAVVHAVRALVSEPMVAGHVDGGLDNIVASLLKGAHYLIAEAQKIQTKGAAGTQQPEADTTTTDDSPGNTNSQETDAASRSTFYARSLGRKAAGSMPVGTANVAEVGVIGSASYNEVHRQQVSGPPTALIHNPSFPPGLRSSDAYSEISDACYVPARRCSDPHGFFHQDPGQSSSSNNRYYTSSSTTGNTDASRPAMMTLRAYLQEVATEDPGCVFVARRIHLLGFHSPKRLREHFSQYGQVVKVLVAHRKLNPAPDAVGHMVLKKRPGSLGLVVMMHKSSVQNILALGADQTVGGHQVSIEAFVPSKTDDLTTDEAQRTQWLQ